MEEVGIYPKYVVFKHPKMPTEQVWNFEGLGIIPSADPLVQPSFSTHLELVDDFVFVLKPLKDPAARVAMAAYAEAIHEEKPQLARDIWQELSEFHEHGDNV